MAGQGKRPAFQFYPGDWIRDPVAGCSLAAQGLWLRMMILAHDSDRYGHLAMNGVAMLPEHIAQRCGCPLETYTTLLDELSAAGVPSRTTQGIIYSRRMVRDERLRQLGRKNGRKGGNPALGRGLTPPDNPPLNHSLEDEDEDETIPENFSSQKSAMCDEVLKHYRKFHPRAKPGAKERAKINDRLGDGYTVDDLKSAIDGCHKSPYHCGENPGGTLYQSLELIVRDSKHVQQFIEIDAAGTQPVLSEKNRRNLRAAAQFVSERGGDPNAL